MCDTRAPSPLPAKPITRLKTKLKEGPMVRSISFLAVLACGLAAACATGDHTSTRYVDPMTCEIKNRQAGEEQYDPQCIKAAQAAAAAAAKDAARQAASKGKR
jgi:hypothetical protein